MSFLQLLLCQYSRPPTKMACSSLQLTQENWEIPLRLPSIKSLPSLLKVPSLLRLRHPPPPAIRKKKWFRSRLARIIIQNKHLERSLMPALLLGVLLFMKETLLTHQDTTSTLLRTCAYYLKRGGTNLRFLMIIMTARHTVTLQLSTIAFNMTDSYLRNK